MRRRLIDFLTSLFWLLFIIAMFQLLSGCVAISQNCDDGSVDVAIGQLLYVHVCAEKTTPQGE